MADDPPTMDPTNDYPLTRRSTLSSTTSAPPPETCRICRSEPTATEPLFHPCKCNGSIRHVHQECLMEWLSHSRKTHCELCKTAFRFTKLYDADMPATLPWGVFVRRAGWHVLQGAGRTGRGVVVAGMWLGVVPWVVRWVWRWLFWLADAGWAKEGFVGWMGERLEEEGAYNGTSYVDRMGQMVGMVTQTTEQDSDSFPARIARSIYSLASPAATSNAHTDLYANPTTNFTQTLPTTAPSLLTPFPHLAHPTSSPRLNALLLDIFEGQLITCLIITAFILIFLIREWVVQQPILMNLRAEDAGVDEGMMEEWQVRLRETQERVRAQREALEETRGRLERLGEGTGFVGWERLGEVMDEGTEYMRIGEGEGGEVEYARFVAAAREFVEQVRAAKAQSVTPEEITRKLAEKLSAYGVEERRRWEGVLLEEFAKQAVARRKKESSSAGGADAIAQTVDESDEWVDMDEDDSEASTAPRRRPRLPERDFMARATRVQRSLVEADEETEDQGPAIGPSPANVPRLLDVTSMRDEVRQEMLAAFISDSFRLPDGEAAVPAPPSTAPAQQPPERTGTNDGDGNENASSKPTRAFDPLPITNAGPDAKVNIKISGTGRLTAVPEPRDEEVVERETEELEKLEREIAEEDGAVGSWEGAGTDADSAAAGADSATAAEGDANANPAADQANTNNNPFHPAGRMPPERRNSESFGNRVASVFREEFGFEDAGHEFDELRVAINQPLPPERDEGEPGVDAEPDEVPRRVEVRNVGLVGRIRDWFWGDIRAPAAAVAQLAPRVEEERRQREVDLDGDQAEAPFVPVRDGEPAPHAHAPQPPVQPHAHAAPPPAQPHADHDPEVLAAAQAAGLDPEAIEDAEDLEGIFELLGLQGPIIGLFQTSAFCLLLVSATVGGAVVAPYIFGKVVLSLVGSPGYFLVQVPLRAAGAGADFVVDVGVVVLSGLGMVVQWVVRALGVGVTMPGFSAGVVERLAEFWLGASKNAGARLQGLLSIEQGPEDVMWSWAILAWSVHSHASLRQIGDEVDAILSYISAAITWTVETISSGSVLTVCTHTLRNFAHIPDFPHHLHTTSIYLHTTTAPLLTFVKDLSHGSLNFSPPSIPSDPTLIHWTPTDRFLAILTGYATLAALAAIYVALDSPLTLTEAGQRTEKAVRDGLRQAGGVLKVILIISIEMLVFPLYCGLLLDLAFLPLFPGASVATRWAFAGAKPWTFCFVHWFVGTCYMFHFALFVGMCRKILRKGVLWFVRDPDDPTFHPVRDVLERNVGVQLRKIAFSALVYGALVILCLGGVVWTVTQLGEGVFPVRWGATEPVLEFPFNLFVYNFVTPLVLRVIKPTEAVGEVYGWWLRRCARGLRLSHFLFGQRRREEEGVSQHESWKEMFETLSSIWWKADDDARPEAKKWQDPRFTPNGKFVLTPCNDQYRPPKPGEAFLHVHDDDVFISDRHGHKNDHFARIYVPPLFRVRVTLFMVCLWLFSAGLGLCATILPLVIGRRILSAMLPDAARANDLYAYSIGAYLLSCLLFTALKGRRGAAFVKTKARSLNAWAWISRAQRLAARILRCCYVYGFLGIVIPTVFALVLQFYLILPLQTWAASVASSSTPSAAGDASTANNATLSLAHFANLTASPTETNPSLSPSTFHILQSYALGLVYARIALRLIFTAPASRAAEAFRRITAPGYFDPDVRLATRFVVLPATLFSLTILLVPAVGAKVAFTIITSLRLDGGVLAEEGSEERVKMYRYAYPLAASAVMLVLACGEVLKATRRWRARIRDEVYLVGERLHNFGEKRPPEGTGSVVRRER
ncbi:uncharacterized protein LTR77_005232 [Saxophila tyrrhenica]|uniref:RING-type E3 ubiquitin transferase n=1 Tax=Saxophila tyrrhenica TaxID=1690608 RepID=A0AAV9PFF8_9PEZI|nr:hypothetical protein LTR77_005232 [Saxophila tyrrhenica]